MRVFEFSLHILSVTKIYRKEKKENLHNRRLKVTLLSEKQLLWQVLVYGVGESTNLMYSLYGERQSGEEREWGNIAR